MDSTELILQELQKINGRLDKLEEQQSETAKNVVVLMDAEFKPRFNLLADGQQAIIERLDRMEDRLEDMDVMDTRITALEAMVKKLNREVASMKKVN